MIEKDHPKLSIRKQADLLEVNRNRLQSVKKKLREGDEEIMKNIDVIYTKWPFYQGLRMNKGIDYGFDRKH